MATLQSVDSPRKAPKQARSKETVEAILQATARILVKEGIENASTNRVAEAAGVSVGSLYQYFPNKDALIEALSERHREKMRAVVTKHLARADADDLRSIVRALVEAMIAAHRVDPKLHAVVLGHVLKNHADVRRSFEADMLTLVRSALELRKADIRPRDLDVAAFILVHTVEGVTHAAVLEDRAMLASTSLVPELVELVVRYLDRA